MVITEWALKQQKKIYKQGNQLVGEMVITEWVLKKIKYQKNKQGNQLVGEMVITEYTLKQQAALWKGDRQLLSKVHYIESFTQTQILKVSALVFCVYTKARRSRMCHGICPPG